VAVLLITAILVQRTQFKLLVCGAAIMALTIAALTVSSTAAGVAEADEDQNKNKVDTQGA